MICKKRKKMLHIITRRIARKEKGGRSNLHRQNKNKFKTVMLYPIPNITTTEQVMLNTWYIYIHIHVYIYTQSCYVLRKGDQLPWMEGVSVCQRFFSLVDLFPDEVLSLDRNCATSSTGKLQMDITWLFPFTMWYICGNMWCIQPPIYIIYIHPP